MMYWWGPGMSGWGYALMSVSMIRSSGLIRTVRSAARPCASMTGGRPPRFVAQHGDGLAGQRY